ncbi:MAG: hypothetical protein K6T90_11210 [Leptolyngbyaceae cyanobacterium HOT.MB2.61]|nr:hypothetical protein [Leptolyngbyaceae cyanobacterium HOT.MB2.61]
MKERVAIATDSGASALCLGNKNLVRCGLHIDWPLNCEWAIALLPTNQAQAESTF